MDCCNCKFWIEVSPSWSEPCGNNVCVKNRSEFWESAGCELKELEETENGI